MLSAVYVYAYLYFTVIYHREHRKHTFIMEKCIHYIFWETAYVWNGGTPNFTHRNAPVMLLSSESEEVALILRNVSILQSLPLIQWLLVLFTFRLFLPQEKQAKPEHFLLHIGKHGAEKYVSFVFIPQFDHSVASQSLRRNRSRIEHNSSSTSSKSWYKNDLYGSVGKNHRSLQDPRMWRKLLRQYAEQPSAIRCQVAERMPTLRPVCECHQHPIHVGLTTDPGSWF
jgi:hypothetical protein